MSALIADDYNDRPTIVDTNIHQLGNYNVTNLREHAAGRMPPSMCLKPIGVVKFETDPALFVLNNVWRSVRIRRMDESKFSGLLIFFVAN
jgi:hypothetical protein